MKQTIGLQRWGVEEAMQESALINSLVELSWRPPTQANKTSMSAIIDDLKALYQRFREGAESEYHVTISIVLFGETRKEHTEIVKAKSEDEAKTLALQNIFNQLDTKITVKKA
jgi:hypothetical protein